MKTIKELILETQETNEGFMSAEDTFISNNEDTFITSKKPFEWTFDSRDGDIDFKIEVIDDLNENWEVRLTVLNSKDRNYKKGFSIEFEVEKDATVDDFVNVLQHELEYQKNASKSRG